MNIIKIYYLHIHIMTMYPNTTVICYFKTLNVSLFYPKTLISEKKSVIVFSKSCISVTIIDIALGCKGGI
jgi:hypothetical protein